MRGAEVFMRAIESQGVTHCFGIVGREAEAMLFTEVDGVQFFLTRHEFTAGVMAEVFARLTGRMQLCFSTFGPGLTNLSTGVASAMLDRSPMLAVSAQVEQHDVAFNHCHQCIDNLAVMRPLTKYAAEFEQASAIPSLVARATSVANTELYGPSYLSFPIDVMHAEVEGAAALDEIDRHKGARGMAAHAPDPHEIIELGRMIARAQHPVAIVGNPVFRERAEAELLVVVEKFGIPVVSTLASKGALTDDHTHAIGPVNRYLDQMLRAPLLDETFGPADLVLLIGYDLSEDVKPVHWTRGRPATVALISSVPNPVPELLKVDHAVIGSIKSTLAALASSDFPPRPRSVPVVQRIQKLRRDNGEAPNETGPSIPPRQIVRAARTALGPEGILVSDIGLHKQFAGLFSHTTEPNTFICSNGLGSFGFGIAAAMGAQLACPERRVIAICGDGGFLSNSQDLETMVRYDLPVVIIIFKDGAYGLIKNYQLRGHGRTSSSSVDFLATDFVHLATAHGCYGQRIESPMRLDRALSRALERREPTLIEIPVQYEYPR
jgi:acetolactate synthase-1/2/3 large subunit/N2-(2-carboxyethyl)arginine synthase